MTNDLSKAAIEALFSLSNGKQFWAEITDDTSMAPIYFAGDRVLVERQNLQAVAIGDHAVFVQKNRLAVHPVVQKKKKKIITQGINNGRSDPALSKSTFLGKAVRKQRPFINYVKHLGHFLNQAFLF